uniref:Uncharacterized protein n=2 Tax=Haplochromini TaxID=319058 RepID=A0A3Q2V7G7_HAPBU
MVCDWASLILWGLLWRILKYANSYSVCPTAVATDLSSSMGYLDLPYTQEPVVFPRITHISEVKPSRESHAVISRQKRNILFPSGVKLCAQETAEQVIANHLSYFHLRGKTQCESTYQNPLKLLS